MKLSLALRVSDLRRARDGPSRCSLDAAFFRKVSIDPTWGVAPLKIERTRSRSFWTTALPDTARSRPCRSPAPAGVPSRWTANYGPLDCCDCGDLYDTAGIENLPYCRASPLSLHFGMHVSQCGSCPSKLHLRFLRCDAARKTTCLLES